MSVVFKYQEPNSLVDCESSLRVDQTTLSLSLSLTLFLTRFLLLSLVLLKSDDAKIASFKSYIFPVRFILGHCWIMFDNYSNTIGAFNIAEPIYVNCL